MDNKLPYNSTDHSFKMAYVNNKRVIWTNIAGKGWVAVDPTSGIAYIYDEENDRPLIVRLTDYDKKRLKQSYLFKNIDLDRAEYLIRKKPSADLLSFNNSVNGIIKYTPSGIPYSLNRYTNTRMFNDGVAITSDNKRILYNLKELIRMLHDLEELNRNLSKNTTYNSSIDTSLNNSNSKTTAAPKTSFTNRTNSSGTNTTAAPKTQQPEYNSLFDGTQLSNDSKNDFGNDKKFKSFSQAFNYYRNKGKGTFAWNGKLYNTMKKSEDATQFRQNHASYDSFLGTIGNDGKDGGWGLSRELQTNANLNALGYNEMQTAKEQSATPQRTRLNMFTNDDIRNLGFNNYSGLVNAVSNKANANNNFVKALTDRYGSDTSKWNLSTIENELGVKGKYRRFGRGDFGDMSRSMASWVGKNNGEIDRQNLQDRTGSNGTVYSSKEIRNSFESHNPKQLSFMNWNPDEVLLWNPNIIRNLNQTTKFQEGGQINMDEQQLQQAFIQYLMQKTGAQSLQQLEQVMQLMGEEGLKLAYAQFILEMQQQQVQAAKFGAKLNYINYLNGKCPEGMQMQYYKVGGKLCKKCMQAKQNKLQKSSDPIKAFKCGRKIRKNR